MNPDFDSEYFLFDLHRVLLLALSAWLLGFMGWTSLGLSLGRDITGPSKHSLSPSCGRG
jgi:hypothetical protein